MMPKWEGEDLTHLLEQYLEEIKSQDTDSVARELAQDTYNTLTPEQLEEHTNFPLEQILELTAQSLEAKIMRRVERKWETLKRDWEDDSNH